jgi:hypothetical protein
MARTDNDTWDLASSVGATATMVAAARAMASKADKPLIDDPFAEPLVRAVGVDFFTRLVTGELRPEDLDSDTESVGMQRMTDNMAVRTKFFDEFFLDATKAGIRQAVILASGWIRGPTGWRGPPGRRSTRSTNPMSSSSRAGPWPNWAPSQPRGGAPSRWICATTGRRP